MQRVNVALLSIAGLLCTLTTSPSANFVQDSPTATLDSKAANSPKGFTVENIEGWSVTVEKSLLERGNEKGQLALKALANHLQRVCFIVPPERLKQLKRVRIWVEENNPSLSNMQYHPSRGWLLKNGHSEELAKCVHVPQASELYSKQNWAKHPYVILHELSHAFHDQFLGFENEEIVACYMNAKAKGIYKRVLAHNGRMVEHYGLSNPKEYFAELTEAYFGVNDFYPFVRAELKGHDPMAFSMLQKVWGKID